MTNNLTNLLGPKHPKLTEDDFPEDHGDIDLRNRAIMYMGMRIKATIKKEKDEMNQYDKSEKGGQKTDKFKPRDE